ncbi:helix-turn-helix domain-containing protein [Acholeplasma hippikon]|uniref:Helix-turn-helix domain n=1 Tax=Acholeplasma hippikon TaxID=264636 RepID=A0A449BI54_9MOLU|nr:helix-turn-helix transcriptional regulator [Acholeplasma hippikon]VEU82141.1 Helix-turn-helix domain [Acholeplasma hippikon]
MIQIGNRIKELRIAKKISQEKFSEDLFVTSSAVSKWENNLSYPDLDKIVDIANYFKVSVDYLLDYKIKDNHIDDLISSIETSYKEKTFIYKPEELEKLLKVYSQNFKVNYYIGKYLSFYRDPSGIERFDLALKALENAVLLFSQNNNKAITLYDLQLAIIELYIRMREPQKAIDFIDQNGLALEQQITKSIAYEMLKDHDKVLEHFSNGFILSLTRIINGTFTIMTSFFENKNYDEVKKIAEWTINLIESLVTRESEWALQLLNNATSYLMFAKYELGGNYLEELNKMVYYATVPVDPKSFKTDTLKFNYGKSLSIFNTSSGTNLYEEAIEQFQYATRFDNKYKLLLDIYEKRIKNERSKLKG